MGAYLIRRFLTVLLVIFGISVVVFMIVHLIPGDPARIILGVQADKAKVEQLQRQLGLDKPIFVQYVVWFRQAISGDLGKSVLTGQSVLDAIIKRLPVTLSLAFAALLIALVIALPAGVLSAAKPNSWFSYLATFLSQIGVAIPAFWLGIILILVFSLWNRWLPTFGYVSPREDIIEWARHLVLPAMSVGLISGAIITRFVRSSMLEVLGEDYVSVARAKGLHEWTVIIFHAFRNALIPIVTIVGLQLAYLLSGVVVVEAVFALPGLGRLAFDAVSRRDYPMLQGAVLTVALFFALVNLLVDVLYAYIDPRVKY